MMILLAQFWKVMWQLTTFKCQIVATVDAHAHCPALLCLVPFIRFFECVGPHNKSQCMLIFHPSTAVERVERPIIRVVDTKLFHWAPQLLPILYCCEIWYETLKEQSFQLFLQLKLSNSKFSFPHKYLILYLISFLHSKHWKVFRGPIPGFPSQSRSRPEPGYSAGAGAVTLARLRLHL